VTPATQLICITEGDLAGVDLTCAAPVATALAQSGLVQVSPIADGTWRLSPCGRVGAVRADWIDLVVTPKVGIARLLFLLGYAHNPRFLPEDVQGTTDDDLWPAVAETLCRHTERALARGVLQGYATEEVALRHVRGRVLIDKQITRHPGMLLPIEVSYDEYTVDIAENVVLRTALRRMLTTPRLPPPLRARLQHLDAKLAGVTPLTPGAALPPWKPSRLNQRYLPALRIAELVLRHQSFEVGPGGLNVASFVVNMATVFENFVGTALKEAWTSRPGCTRIQYPATLDWDGEVQMKVDVVHLVDGIPRVLADAKYKLETPAGLYPNADHYQMLAYCTALRVPVAWLIYARGSVGKRIRRVRHTNIEIVEYPLNLTAPPSELLNQIDELAREAWRLPPPTAIGVT